MSATSSAPRAATHVADDHAARVALAAGYRIADHYGWANLIYNHIALRLPTSPDHFLFKPHHLMFSEMRASDLLTLPLGGRHLSESDNVNAAGYTIHGAVLRARADINCTIHVHTAAGIAMSAHRGELLPINQGAMRFYHRLSYHDYEGISETPEECERIVRDLGPKNKVMILRNHGLLACGATVAEALSNMRYLASACEVQLMLEASGAEIVVPPHDVCEKTAQQWERYVPVNDDLDWAAYLRIADRLDPSFRE
jgi:ribulose-5-phosphate 4-epimerase/fuculose-1-phosphate aldolase